MGSIFKYSGITTKIRAMRAGFITKEQYRKLAEMSSVSEIVDFLKGTKAYGGLFKDVDSANIHRGQLENMLILSKYRDFEKMYRFANMEQRRYMNLYFVRYEVSLLKKAIIHALEPENLKLLSAYGEVLGRYPDMDVAKLCNASNIDEIIEVMKDTIFYDTLRMVRAFENPTEVDYEIAIDVFFFNYVWRKRKRLFKGKELEKVTMLYGMEADSLNIMWINRSKIYYSLPPEQIYSMIIPVYYKLKKAQIKALVESENNEIFLQEISKTHYGKYLKDPEYKSNNISKICEKQLEKCYHKLFKLSPYSLSAIDAYLKDKEKEIKNLVVVAECVRYKYPTEQILKNI